MSLSIGMAAFILITIYVTNEWMVDKQHPNAERTFKLKAHRLEGENEHVYSILRPSLAETFKKDVPEVDKVLRLTDFYISHTLKADDAKFKSNRIFYVDSTFFDFFDFKLLSGNKSTALSSPESVVITEQMAKALFGNEDPMGKILVSSFQNRNYTVTGVLENSKENSHLRYDAFFGWPNMSNGDIHIYVMLHDHVDNNAATSKLNDVFKSSYPEEYQSSLALGFQPMKDIYLHSKGLQFLINPQMGNYDNLLVLGIIGIFILINCCINYININTAKAADRIKEIGVRKSLGAGKKQLILQFLGETLIITLIAALIALTIAELGLPAFNNLTGKSLSVALNGTNSLYLIFLIIFIALASGFYPALILSSFKPQVLLKAFNFKLSKGNTPRQVLTVLQFGISIFIIAGAIGIYFQTQYIKDYNLGFNKENVVTFNLKRNSYNQKSTFKEEMMKHADVENVSISLDILGTGGTSSITYIYPEGWTDGYVFGRYFGIDDKFVDTYGMELVAGRNVNEELASDQYSVLVNEKFVADAGWKVEEAIGRTIKVDPEDDQPKTIVGVVKNFHLQSLHHELEATLLQIAPENYRSSVSVRITAKDPSEALVHIHAVWKMFEAEEPLSYRFVDQNFDSFYKTEYKLLKVIILFSIISIIISCLGLYGLTSFTIEQRTKEIGIRKVLGASLADITMRLNSKFIMLILIALVISGPLAWYFTNQWLGSFSYKTDYKLYYILIAGGGTLFIAILSISYKTIKAALSNPVKSLKYE
jgi:putative ABC transport system permease protein